MYYLKLYYKLLEWEWYTNANVMRLFIHCLLKANIKTKKWQGCTIERGSFITSYSHLASELHLSVQQIRTAISKLKITGEITCKQQGSNTMITVKNYNEYQPSNTLNNTQITGEQHANNTLITTTKECKNVKNERMFNTVCINSEKTQKEIDPFSNPLIRYFKDEYFKRFNCRPYLTATERNKIFELASDIEEFKDTIPVTLEKLKNIDFGFENFTPNANWLLKDSNYTAVLNGTYDKQKKKTIWEELKERHNGTT